MTTDEKPLTSLEAHAVLQRDILRLGAAIVRGLPFARLVLGEKGAADTAEQLERQADARHVDRVIRSSTKETQ